MTVWWHRFVNRTDVYAVQTVINGQCQYFSRYQPVTPELFSEHLAGRITLGLPAIDAEGMSRWCCFDSDVDDDSLDRVQQLLTDHGWLSIREGQRTGRSGHLWVFFDRPVPASDLRLFGRRFMDAAGIKCSSRIEFFPKQDKPNFDPVRQRYRACSIVRLPLGIHRKNGAGDRGWFSGVTQCEVMQALWIAFQPFNSAAALTRSVLQIQPLVDARDAFRRSNQTAFSRKITADIAEVRAALSVIPAHDFKVWIQVGMALESAGFPMSEWDRWSQLAPNYDQRALQKHWSTFGRKTYGRKPIGLGTLFYLAAMYRASPFAMQHRSAGARLDINPLPPQ